MLAHVNFRGLYAGLLWTGRRWQIAFLEIASRNNLINWRCYRIDGIRPRAEVQNVISDAGIVLAAGAGLVFLGREMPHPEEKFQSDGADPFSSISVWQVNMTVSLTGKVVLKGFRYARPPSRATTSTPLYFSLLWGLGEDTAEWLFGPAHGEDLKYGLGDSALMGMCYRGADQGSSLENLALYLSLGIPDFDGNDAEKFLSPWEAAICKEQTAPMKEGEAKGIRARKKS